MRYSDNTNVKVGNTVRGTGSTRYAAPNGLFLVHNIDGDHVLLQKLSSPGRPSLHQGLVRMSGNRFRKTTNLVIRKPDDKKTTNKNNKSSGTKKRKKSSSNNNSNNSSTGKNKHPREEPSVIIVN